MYVYVMNYIITMKLYMYNTHLIMCHHLQPYTYISNDLVLLIIFLHEMKHHHNVRIIGAIINHLSITCNTFVIVKLQCNNHSLAIVVVIGRPVNKITSIVTSQFIYKIYTHVLYLKQSPVHVMVTNWPNGKPSASSTLVHSHRCLLDNQ